MSWAQLSSPVVLSIPLSSRRSRHQQIFILIGFLKSVSLACNLPLLFFGGVGGGWCVKFAWSLILSQCFSQGNPELMRLRLTLLTSRAQDHCSCCLPALHFWFLHWSGKVPSWDFCEMTRKKRHLPQLVFDAGVSAFISSPSPPSAHHKSCWWWLCCCSKWCLWPWLCHPRTLQGWHVKSHRVIPNRPVLVLSVAPDNQGKRGANHLEQQALRHASAASSYRRLYHRIKLDSGL